MSSHMRPLIKDVILFKHTVFWLKRDQVQRSVLKLPIIKRPHITHKHNTNIAFHSSIWSISLGKITRSTYRTAPQTCCNVLEHVWCCGPVSLQKSQIYEIFETLEHIKNSVKSTHIPENGLLQASGSKQMAQST